MNGFRSNKRYLKLSLCYLLLTFLVWVILDFIYISTGQNSSSYSSGFDIVISVLALIGFFTLTWKHYASNNLGRRLFST